MRFRALPRAALAIVILGVLALPAVRGSERDVVARSDIDEAIAITADGPVRGAISEDVRLFQGIPYAAPPVGDLRWQSPQPVEPWIEPRAATEPGPWCPQPAGMPGSLEGGEEDCLYLNVVVPRSVGPVAPKPVMVWIHGGGFLSGAGSTMDARRLATGGDVVVVTINYRLGILGYFGYPELTGSSAFGLEDQQAALRWVQQNAAAFGGDPDNVTLFGESAGGMSACAQLTSPAAAGLFQRVIIQSGSCLIDWPNNGLFSGVEAASIWGSPEETAGLGMAVADELGCADPATALDCLRRLPAEGLLQSHLAPAFGHVSYGNTVLPDDPARAMRAGQFLHVPVMMGTTRDEARTFVSFDPKPISDQRYQALLDDAFGDLAGEVAARYPLDAYSSPRLAWASAMTDRVWACPALANDQLFAEQVPVFAYEFADRDAPSLFPFPDDLPGGAYHGAEIAFLFDINVEDFDASFTPDQERLAEVMVGYWTTFARTGDPNGPGLPAWPPVARGTATPYVQSLAPGPLGIGPVDFDAEHRCAFWDDLAEAGPAG